MLTRNSKQPLLQWSLLVKSPRTRQTPIGNHKPWSPTARRKPEGSIPTIWRPKGQTFTSGPSSEHTFNSCQICSLRSIFVLFFMGRVENRPGFLLILNSKKPSTCHDFFTFANYHSPESTVTSFRSSQQCARGKRQAWTRSMFN